MGEKNLKFKLKKIVSDFAEHVKNKPELLFNSNNYEETFLDFCDEDDKLFFRKLSRISQFLLVISTL